MEWGTKTESGPDEEGMLIARVRAGDGSAFAELMGRHAGLVRAVAFKTLGPQEAEDASQDVWLRVWLSLGGFRGESSFATWLYRVSLNTCLTAHRRAALRRSRETSTESDGRQRAFSASGTRPRQGVGQDTGGEDPQAVLADGERRREDRLRVREALSGLREEHKAALVLRHAEGLSYREVAEALGVPSGTAKGWAHRAKSGARAASVGTPPRVGSRH